MREGSTDGSDPRRAPSRRQLLAGVLAAGAVGVAGGAVLSSDGRGTAAPGGAPSAGVAPDAADLTVTPYGAHQAGVARPTPSQAHADAVVLDLPDDVAHDRGPLADVLAGLGTTVAALAAGEHPGLAGLGPARLTVTVGLGPRVVRATRGPGPGADDLPAFARDDLTPATTGGDLLLLVRADEDVVVALARETLVGSLGASGATVRRVAPGFRGPLDGSTNRNVLGFHDGVSVPHGADELDAAVWWDEDVRPGLAGATTAVVRVMPVDVAAFTALPVAEQERVVGRRRAGGEPLSGGTATSDPDLHAKDETGRYAIPVDAHVRRAHPLPAGLDTLMLRRSYSFSGTETGLVFVAFQRRLDTFVRTQHRLDEQDALTAHARTTASGTFLVLPGFTPERPLGAALRD